MSYTTLSYRLIIESPFPVIHPFTTTSTHLLAHHISHHHFLNITCSTPTHPPTTTHNHPHLHTASTNPQLRYVPTTCDQPVCNNDPLLCPDYMVCTDIELPLVLTVESFTTYYFTAEYGLRLLTVWAVTPRVAGVIPAAWEAEHVYNPHAPQPHYSPWYQTIKFVFRFKNLVDLAAILPFYLQYFTTNLPPTNFIRALRLLRLIRVLRLLKLLSFLKNVDVMIDLMLATLSQGEEIPSSSSHEQ